MPLLSRKGPGCIQVKLNPKNEPPRDEMFILPLCMAISNSTDILDLLDLYNNYEVLTDTSADKKDIFHNKNASQKILTNLNFSSLISYINITQPS